MTLSLWGLIGGVMISLILLVVMIRYCVREDRKAKYEGMVRKA